MTLSNRTLRPFTVLALDTSATNDEGEKEPRYLHKHVEATSGREAFIAAAMAFKGEASESILYICATEGTHDLNSSELAVPCNGPMSEQVVSELPDWFTTNPLTHTEAAQRIEEAALSLRGIVDFDLPQKGLTADSCKRNRMLALIDELRQVAQGITADDMKPNGKSFNGSSPQTTRWL